MLRAAESDENDLDKFDESYFNEKLKDIDDFLCYTKRINPSVIPDRLKSEFNKIYVKCGCISSFWDIYDKDNQSICKIDESLWLDNFLLKYLFEDSISYKDTAKTCLHCKICDVHFDAHPVYLRYHLNEQSHIFKYNNDRNKVKDDLWKNFLSYRHAYENFVVFNQQHEIIHCKICGINLPISHSDLIDHLDSVRHVENFKDIFNFKSNNFKSKQLIDSSSISGNDNNKRKLEVELNSDTSNEYKRSKETVDDLHDQGVSYSDCLGENIDVSDSKALLSGFSNFNEKGDEILEGGKLKEKHEAVANKKEIIIDRIFTESEIVTKHGEFMAICWENVESNKYFCEVCNYFDINLSSSDFLLEHEHLTENYREELNSCQWRHCKFCSAMLFCSVTLFSCHYCHPIHQEFVNLFILRESSLGVEPVLPILKKKIMYLTNRLIKENTRLYMNEKKGFVCVPCYHVTSRSGKFAKHLRCVGHSERCSSSSNNKIFKCDCLLEFYCDNDYYDGHKFSVSHVNVIDFLAELIRGQQSTTSSSNPVPNSDVYYPDSIKKVFKSRTFEKIECNESERNICDEGKSTSCETQGENASRFHLESSDCVSISTINEENRYGNQLDPNILLTGELSENKVKSIRKKHEKITQADIDNHYEFMTAFSRKTDVFKFFCQLCGCFEINSSDNNISVHENSAKHILNLNSGILENCEWRYCQFCSTRLFCNFEMYCHHYRHQVHLKFVNISILTGQNVYPTNEVFNSKWKVTFSKYSMKIGKLQLRHLFDTILITAQKNYSDQVFGFYCYPCDYMTFNNLNWTRHLNIANHYNNSKRALNDLFCCDCHTYLYCDTDFYYGHTFSREHINLISFFSQGMCVQQSKKFSEPFVSSSVTTTGKVNKEPQVHNLIENDLCKVNPMISQSSGSVVNENVLISNDTQKDNEELRMSESSCSDCNALENESNANKMRRPNLETVVKLCVDELKIKKKISKTFRKIENAKHEEFLSRFCGLLESFKFFCQPCVYFEMNSSDNLLSEHENSVEHIRNLDSISFLRCKWRNCEFCCAKLCCSTKLFSEHSRHGVHLDYVKAHILKYKNVYSINQLSSSASAKTLSNKEKEIVKRRDNVMKFIVNDIITKLGKLPKRVVKFFFCYYCCDMTDKECKWISHMHSHEGNVNLRDYKVFHCNCNITMYCNDLQYNQHMSSTEHVAITSFISEGLCIQDNNRIIPISLKSETYRSMDNNSGTLMGKHDENNLHTGLENYSCNLDTPTKKDNGNLHPSGDENRIKVEEDDVNFHERFKEKSAEKDGSNIDILNDKNFEKGKSKENFTNFTASNSEGVIVSNFRIKENSIKLTDITSNNKKIKRLRGSELKSSYLANYNEFMEKTVLEKFYGFKYFCQFCGVLKTNCYSRTLIASEHESSETHLNNVSVFLKIHNHGSLKSCSWRQCEFCSIVLLCTRGILNDHYQHPIHLQMVEDSIRKKKKEDTNNYEDVKRSDNSKNGQLNSLMSAVMKKSFTNTEYIIKGYYCSVCDYCTSKMLKWNAHMISYEHQQNCLVPTFRNYFLTFKTINCSCHISFFCSDEFCSVHKSSVMHTNLVKFFKELSRSHTIKKGNSPLKSKSSSLFNNEEVSEDSEYVIFKMDKHNIYWFGLTGLLEVSEKDISQAFSKFGTVVCVDIFEPNLANICICVSDESINRQDIFGNDMKISVNGVYYQIKEKNILECKIPDVINLYFSKNLSNFLNTLYLSAKEEVHQSVEVSGNLVLKTQIVEDDLKTILCEVQNVTTIGSRALGLAQSDCLHDLFVEMGSDLNEDNGSHNIDGITSRTAHIKRKLESTKGFFTFRDVKEDGECVMAEHKSTGLKCRIFCKNSLVVENTNLIRLYANTGEVVKQLIILIKEWIKHTEFSYLISSYTLTWMILFYLMQLKITMIRPVNLLRKKYKGKIINIAGWNCSFIKDATATVTLRGKQNVFSLIDLLKGFFNFYGNNNIAAYVLCPMTGEIFLKSKFKNSEFPIWYSEFPTTYSDTSFVSYLQQNMYSDKFKVLNISKGICLQDPLELNKNLTVSLQGTAMYKFQWLCKKMIDIVSDHEFVMVSD